MAKQVEPWHHTGKKRKTIQVVCATCVKTSHITLYGLTNEYRDIITKEKCIHCGVTGKLTTNELAKPRVKPDNTRQLSLNWGNNDKK
jgi:hypothetical protein